MAGYDIFEKFPIIGKSKFVHIQYIYIIFIDRILKGHIYINVYISYW